MEDFVIKTRADSAALAKAATALEQASWNQFGFLNFTKAHYSHYEELLGQYADHQLCLVDQDNGYPIAVANCVPMACTDEQLEDLPSEGWDWIVENAAATRGKPANTLGVLAISVPDIHRGKGLGRVMINAVNDLSKAKGFKTLLAPVRPTAKAAHPYVAIDDYVSWRDPSGRFYDPWLRSHDAAGGIFVKPCKRSMVVEEPVAFWETWARQHFTQSGAYAIEGGLTPIEIDLETRVGRYAEPNVWFAYKN